MGMPVVTVASGGMPVVEAASGTPVTEATNGYGMRVTKVVGKPGMPVTFETIDLSGGGGAPAWVPDDAKIHIDFLGGTPQGRAWVEGTGEVAVETLLGTALHPYNPAYLNSNGYQEDGIGVDFVGAALPLLLGTFTYRVVTKDIFAATNVFVLYLVSDDTIDGIVLRGTNSSAVLRGYSLSENSLFIEIAGSFQTADDAVNCFALTIAGSRFDMAVNGSAVATGEIDGVDRPSGNPLTSARFWGTDYAFQSITLYDPLPSTAGLSALSVVT